MLTSNQYKSISRLNWTAEEEKLLKVLRENNGIKSWTKISTQLNKVIQEKNRSGKQCRERYMNYVRFSNNTNSSKWTIQEEKELFQYFLIYGRKWVQICKKLNGKSQNCLKNRFYGAIRKISRRINKTFKEKKLKQKKILKQETFMKILETKQNTATDHVLNKNLTGLKNGLLRLAITPEQDLLHQQIISFTNKVYDYLSHARLCQDLRKGSKKIEQKQFEKSINELDELADSFNIYSPKLQASICVIFEEEQNSKEKQQRTYLFQLGLDLIKYNSSVTYDLDKQVGEILNQEFVEQNLQIL